MARSRTTAVPISPLTGPLDTRSLPNELPTGSMRWRQNLRTTENGKLCRGDGWTKFLTTGGYNNQDLHDQLLTFTHGIRQPIVFQGEFQSGRGVRRYFAATQNAIYRLNSSTGNWAMLGSGYGNGSTSANDYRWHCSQVGDFLTFSNGYNKVLSHAMEEASLGNPLLATIDDLDVIGLTRAGVVWSWRNVQFLADVDMDSQRYPYRVVWGDYGNPKSFDPAVESSIAGFQDLEFDERILAGLPMADSFLIYTTHGIWVMTAVGGAQSFAFRKAFSSDANHQKCLFYPNTLVAYGTNHFYMGKERIYSFNIYSLEPSVASWLDQAAGTLFDGLDQTACNAHVGHLDGHEIYFSVAKRSDAHACPSITLRGHQLFKAVDYIDHGFTSFGQHQPGYGQNLRDWLVDNRICTLQSLTDQGYGFTNEGLPAPQPTPSAAFAPQSIYTQHPLTVTAPGSTVTTEDYTRPNADADSLCVLLGGLRFDDICRTCDTQPLLVAASSADWCLKQINGVFYRERCANTTAVGTTGALGYTSSSGAYLLDSYDSIFRWAPAFTDGANIEMNLFRVDYLTEVAGLLNLRIGLSGQIADPNTDDCRLVWHPLSAKPMNCLSPSTVGQHLNNNTSPQLGTWWNFKYAARFICVELKLSGVGGSACFSGVDGSFEPVSTKNYG